MRTMEHSTIDRDGNLTQLQFVATEPPGGDGLTRATRDGRQWLLTESHAPHVWLSFEWVGPYNPTAKGRWVRLGNSYMQLCTNPPKVDKAALLRQREEAWRAYAASFGVWLPGPVGSGAVSATGATRAELCQQRDANWQADWERLLGQQIDWTPDLSD